MDSYTEQQLQLDLSLENEFEREDEGGFGALVAANHKWLGHYARMHATFSVEHTLLERNSIWMNAYFQKNRMITSPWSKQAKALVKKHQQTVLERLRCVPSLHSESEFSTQSVEPVAALMFAASVDRCPEVQLEYLMSEAMDLLECNALRTSANRSGFAGCAFRFLTQYTEDKKRILCLQLLVLLAEDDADAAVRACQIAAQGQHWQPNMFIYTLQKRHSDNEIICNLVIQLLQAFSERMPITSPIHLDSPRSQCKSKGAGQEEHFVFNDQDIMRGDSGSSPHRKTQTLPSLGSPKATSQSPTRALHSPTTTMSSLYMEEPSPYAPNMRLPITRPVTSPLEQSRRSKIFSTPKLAAVDGDKQRRCRTPNARELSRPNHFQLAAFDVEINDGADPQAHKLRSLDPLDVSPPRSPEGDSPKKRVVLSEKYSWNPECINSVSGFEWWWRSLPQNHSNLEPTQKLKMVTKAAVRLHTKEDWQRAIELYQLALSMKINVEVEFRLRINLACAYEAAQELPSSIQAFRAALELNPEDPYARFKLGEVLGATRQFVEARTLFQSALSAYPQAADALKKLQQTETLQMEEEEAKQAATAAVKLRRSLSKKKRGQQKSEHEDKNVAVASNSAVQPTAPFSPATSSPASRRASEKLKKASERAPRVESSPAECTENNEPAVANKSVAILAPTSRDAPLATLDLHTTSEGDVSLNSACSAAESTRENGHLSVQDILAARSHVSVASVGIMAQVSTMSVGTVTDVCESQIRVLDLLVERCTDLDINLRKYLLQFDSCQKGLVRLESLTEMIRILCGAAFSDLSDSALASEIQQALSDDAWLRIGSHTFARQQSILATCEAKMRQVRLDVQEVESGVVHRQLQQLAERETLFLVRFLAERSTESWMREGAQRAAGNANDARAPADHPTKTYDATKDPELTMQKGPRSADVEDQADFIPQDLLEINTLAQTLDQEHAGVPADGETNDGGFLDGVLSEEGDAFTATDGCTTVSSGMNGRREKARQEQILRREKSRIFARKHIHCLRSLRELAVLARKHHVARCEAREFLAQVVDDSRGKLGGMQAKMDGKSVVAEPTNQFEDLQASSGAQSVQKAMELSDMSHTVVGDAVDAAIRKIVTAASGVTSSQLQPHTVVGAAVDVVIRNVVATASGLTVSQLQSLARRFAAFSQVPPLLQACCAPPEAAAFLAHGHFQKLSLALSNFLTVFLVCQTNEKLSIFSALRKSLPPSPAETMLPATLFPAAHSRSSNMLSYSQHRVLALSLATPQQQQLRFAACSANEKSERPGLKLLIGAGVTFGYEMALGHYFEFVKILKQTRPGESYLRLTKEMMHAKGPIGIWDGFFPWGALQAVAKGSVFSWGHAVTRQGLQPYVEQKKVSKGTAEVIAGGIGGGFQGFALSPTLLLKTRVMTDPVFRLKMTPLETCKASMNVGMKVIRNEGVMALMKGSTVFSLKRVADWSTRFFFSVQSENFLYKRTDPNAVLTTNEKMTASLLGGILSSLVTLPIDVMVAQIQQASKAGANVSVVDMFRDEFKRGGIKQVAGFATTGFVVRALHVSFTTMIMKTATSVIYEAYEERQQ